MSVIIFLVILSALIIVHELGHFFTAKKFGIRVDEFGLGYPPRAAKLFSWKGSDFTLNWLPFGGFVKIYGENPTEAGEEVSKDNFQSKNRCIQASVLAAGVFFNFLFAWLLISLGFVTGIPSPAGIDLPLENPQTVVTLVVPGSPADVGGLKAGDTLISMRRGDDILEPGETAEPVAPAAFSQFISFSTEPIVFTVERGDLITEKIITPAKDIIAERPAVGIAMETIGTVHLPIHKALWEGLKTTCELTWITAKAILSLIGQAFTGKADLGSVTGPVGIVGMVGDMRELGLSYLVTFTALLSINLSIINLLPFPALDGGRLLMVGIESITRRPIPASYFNAINAAGFALLIFLMILITIQDVRNIF